MVKRRPDAPLADRPIDQSSYQWLPCDMRSVGIKVLKNKLSEYIRIAASGETVLVTDRDRVVAELVPPHPDRSKMLADARWAELIRQGLVTPAVNPAGRPPKNDPIMTIEQILADLDEDRADR
jgi:antitoxin (DNA-binding transcriptional repressor) of toxin-antitoxin stability system